MPVARLPLSLTVATLALFVAGNAFGWVTHDLQTAGSRVFLLFPTPRCR